LGEKQHKYDKDTKAVRRLSKEMILQFLEKKSASSEMIAKNVKVKLSNQVNDKILCECGSRKNRPEWIHQVFVGYTRLET